MVFLGSGLGGVCRFVAGKAVQSHFAASSLFPWGTFAVNVTGCLLIGLFYGLFDRYVSASGSVNNLRLLLTVGFCGGFTTFSTFMNEGSSLMKDEQYLYMMLYLFSSLILGLIAVMAGHQLAKFF